MGLPALEEQRQVAGHRGALPRAPRRGREALPVTPARARGGRGRDAAGLPRRAPRAPERLGAAGAACVAACGRTPRVLRPLPPARGYSRCRPATCRTGRRRTLRRRSCARESSQPSGRRSGRCRAPSERHSCCARSAGSATGSSPPNSRSARRPSARSSCARAPACGIACVTWPPALAVRPGSRAWFASSRAVTARSPARGDEGGRRRARCARDRGRWRRPDPVPTPPSTRPARSLAPPGSCSLAPSRSVATQPRRVGPAWPRRPPLGARTVARPRRRLPPVGVRSVRIEIERGRRLPPARPRAASPPEVGATARATRRQ